MKRLIAFLMTVTVMIAFVPVAMAADTTIVVSPANLNGWSYTNFGTAASQAFVLGPGIPPLGSGSAAFTHSGPPGDNGGTLHTRTFDGIYLRDITELKYWTYQEGANALLFQPPYVQLFLDLNDDGTVDDGIGFEPSWQSGGRFMVTSLQSMALSPANTMNEVQNGLDLTGAGVAANQWWEWDLLKGSWWGRGGPLSTGATPDDRLGGFECNQFVGGCATIAGIVEAYPNARIISQQTGANTGGVRLQYGFGGNSDEYIGHVDKLVFGVTGGDKITYDFELQTPRGMKQGVVASLGALLPTGNKKTDDQIGKAIVHLSKSLDPALWVDDSHLTKKGEKVFDEEKDAVNELMKINNPPAAVSNAINSLLAADQALAQTAINDAIAASGDPKEIAKAQDEMAKAAQEIGKGHLVDAIEHYKNAWLHAQKA